MNITLLGTEPFKEARFQNPSTAPWSAGSMTYVVLSGTACNYVQDLKYMFISFSRNLVPLALFTVIGDLPVRGETSASLLTAFTAKFNGVEVLRCH